MIVIEKHRALVMRVRDPGSVKQLIPTAKSLQFKGYELTVVPHRLDEYKLLRNVGFSPPHPVDHYYGWPGQFTPMEAQRATVRLLSTHPRAYCLNGLGTGKTLSALWAFDFLRQERQASKLLVVAPLSTLDRTWGDELFRHLTHLRFLVLYGTAKRRRQLLKEDADVYIINHDGVQVIQDELSKRTDIDTLIVDELSQVARNAHTDRWKSLRALCQGRARIWGMTGTPTPNAPTDAWAQAKLLTPGNVPAFYSHFRDMTMRQVATYKWVTKSDANDIVFKALQPAIRFKREDCLDLPPVTYETREVALTTTQDKLYASMRDQFYAQYQGGEITAVNEAVKAMRLIQICCGAATDADGENIVFIPPTKRVAELLTIIEEAASKVIVFVPFKPALKALHEAVSKHYTAEMIHGEVSKPERDRIIGAFQGSADPQVLVAQPAAMSHGLTLTAASVIVWFAPITSAEIYEQANARITRPGQVHNQLIIHIQGTALESRMYERLRKKVSLQGVLLDMFRDATT